MVQAVHIPYRIISGTWVRASMEYGTAWFCGQGAGFPDLKKILTLTLALTHVLPKTPPLPLPFTRAFKILTPHP